MEDRLRAVTVGPLSPLTSAIVIEDYNSAWPSWYEEVASDVRSILGDRIRRLEHVGSTSVPGLAAKPIIDMALTVVDSSDEDAYVAPLEQHGYALRIREPDWYQHRLLKGPRHNINLHVFSEGCPEVERMVVFRDRLRQNAGDRERYENAKRALAQKSWRYVQSYADAKTEIVKSILSDVGEP
jgi:GrpB-like predicted nucleotidyltransferase (UPF0157 family)